MNFKLLKSLFYCNLKMDIVYARLKFPYSYFRVYAYSTWHFQTALLSIHYICCLEKSTYVLHAYKVSRRDMNSEASRSCVSHFANCFLSIASP